MNGTQSANNSLTCALRSIVAIRSTRLQTARPSLSHRLHRIGLWAALLVGLLAANADAAPTYVLGTNGNLWCEYGNSGDRTLVDVNVKAFQSLDDFYTVFVLSANGFLWCEYGNSGDRNVIDGNVVGFQDIPWWTR